MNCVEFLKSNKIRFNCLTQFHSIKTCKSSNKCRKRNKSNHTLPHFETTYVRNEHTKKEVANTVRLLADASIYLPASTPTRNGPNQNYQDSNVVAITTLCLSNLSTCIQILLCTEIIRVKDSI